MNPEERKQRYPNLKPWKPGQSGNPHGRIRFETLVQRELDQRSEAVPGKTRREALAAWFAEKLSDPAFLGLRANRDLLDRFLERCWPAVKRLEVEDVSEPGELRSGPSAAAFREALEIGRSLELTESIREPETDTAEH